MDLPFSKAFLRKDYLSRAKTASAVVALTLAILTLTSVYAHVPLKFKVAIPFTLFAVLIPYIYALRSRSRAGVLLQLTEEGISLPRFLFSHLRKIVPYTAIYSKKETQFFKHELLRLDFVGGTYIFSSQQFEKKEDFEHLCRNIHENKELNTSFPTPLISWLLTLVIVCFSLALLYMPSSTLVLNLLFFGAWERDLILSGEIDRLISYGLLHANLIHLFSNIISLAFLGLALEHRVGKLNFLIIFSAGICVSSLGAAASNYFLVVGASGGVYSLLGAYVADREYHPDPNLERYKSTTNRLIIIAVGIEACISLFFSEIALSVHLTGFAFGIAYMMLITHPKLKLKTQLTFGAFALVLTIMHLLRISSFSDQYVYDHSVRWITENNNPTTTKIAAWSIATSKLSKSQDLDLAIKLMQNTEQTNDGLDTLATLYARKGRYAEAVETENSRIKKDRSDFTQLARFERAYTAENPIDISQFAGAKTIAVDAICDEKRFVRIHTRETDKIPNVCNNQEIIYIRIAKAGGKNIRYELDPKLMALPL